MNTYDEKRHEMIKQIIKEFFKHMNEYELAKMCQDMTNEEIMEMYEYLQKYGTKG